MRNNNNIDNIQQKFHDLVDAVLAFFDNPWKVIALVVICLTVVYITNLFTRYYQQSAHNDTATISHDYGILRMSHNDTSAISHDYGILRVSYDAAIKAAEEQIVSLNEQLNTALQSIDLQQKAYTDLAAEYHQKTTDENFLRIRLISSDITIDTLRNEYEAEKAKTARLEIMLAAAEYEAVKLERKLAAAHDEYDEALRVLFFGNNDGMTQDSKKSYYTKAFDFLKGKAEAGNREAQYLVGYMLDPWHKNISGVAQNADEAMIAYKKVSDDKNAQFCIGRLYYYEYKDEYVNAAKWLLKAAYQEHDEAAQLLGYMDGKGHIIEDIRINMPDTIKRMRFRSNVNIGRMKAKEQ